MWTSDTQSLGPLTKKVSVVVDSRTLSYREVIELWLGRDGEFRSYFSRTISDCGFESFFWETPPVTKDTVDREFEFVVVEGAALQQLKPDPSPFAVHFASRSSQQILTFPNLGGDAVLVVPTPVANHESYTHLARFLRNAPPLQVDALWQSVGNAMRGRISNSPTWLSTAGLGVSWLHLRLDSRPKYYRHGPYKTNY